MTLALSLIHILPDTQITDLGTARQIKVTKDNTVIVDGAGDANEIKARIAEIKNTILSLIHI